MRYCESYFEEMNKAAKSLDLSAMKGKSILITGGSGLICSAVVDVLMAANNGSDADITIYLASLTEKEIEDRFPVYLGSDKIKYVHYNALEPVDFDFHADFIIHGASNAHPAAYIKEPVETLLANVTGIKELLDYAKKTASERVLYISSSEVYGKKEEFRPYVEDDYGFVDILNTRACYPSGKRASETLCAAYYAEYGVETVIVRPGHIYGPTLTASDSRATAQFTRDVLAGNDIIMKSSGAQLRSYCYSTDCATAILTVLLKGQPTEAYNISNSSSIVSIRQIAEAFADAGNCKVVVEDASEEEKKGYNMMDNSSLDSHKIEALGWKAVYSAAEGAERTIRTLSE